MPDEVVGAGNQAATNGEAPPEVSAAPVAPEAPSAETQFDPDAHLASLSDEKRAEYVDKYFGKDVNRRVDQGINKTRQKLEAEYKQRETQRQAQSAVRQQAEQIVAGVRALTAEQQATWLMDPKNATTWAQANEVLKQTPGGGVTDHDYAQRLYSGVKSKLAEDEAYGDYDWSKAEELDGMAFIHSLGEHKAQKLLATERKAMQEEFKKEMQAVIAGELAKLHRQSEEPSNLPPGGAAASKRFSAAAIDRMGLAEFKAREAEIDEAVRNGWIDP